MVKDIKIEDYNYELPDEKIARHPSAARDDCRLLLFTPANKIFHRKFKEIAGLLPPASLMVCNDTKVINARLEFHKDTGARIEIFLLEPIQPADYSMMFQQTGSCRWKCLVGNLKKWKEGLLQREVSLSSGERVTLSARKEVSFPTEGDGIEITFSWTPPDIPFDEILENAGRIPIPPYLNRDSEPSDLSDYQTIYAETNGSVAAPTAGLHFTTKVMEDIAAHGIDCEKLTLHVGAGTFKPVKSEHIGDHPMHTETFSITKALLYKLISQIQREGKITAVGTTTVRTLESLPYLGMHIARGREDHHVSQWEAYDDANRDTDTLQSLKNIAGYLENKGIDSLTASTSIMIAPGFKWRVTDALVTNFHQPGSTLLLLVSSFTGDLWRKIYEEALRENYRFLSYGDACLLIRN